jgi:GH43 family beta-xylosidase
LGGEVKASDKSRILKESTYLNPVHDRPCPDPFVLKHLGEYWCYSTGFWRDGRSFGVMHSRDLVNWRELAGAMEPLAGGYTCYWAPEVIYHNGRFLLYYSVGNEERMQIRAAEASHPAGPFIDSGHVLTTQEFAIDPHVFEDTDGARYLFYATDFLTHTHVGTGTVVDRMIDPFTLAGNPRPVTRARYDWQVYDPNRAEKGGVRWHTVEGPFVLKRKGLYYEMFSGGNWKNITYGVSYGVTDDINTEDEWEQASDGERVLPILRTAPGKVIGPGHNSVVRGPDNQQLFCVYHRWAEDGSDRVLAIDRQDWAGKRMIILGPSTTPQPAPLQPALAGFYGEDRDGGLGPDWICLGGEWAVRDGAAIQSEVDTFAKARHRIGGPCFVMETSLRALVVGPEPGAIGVSLWGENRDVLRVTLVTGESRAVMKWYARDGWTKQTIELPREFDPVTYHLLRIEVNASLASVTLDGSAVAWQGRLGDDPRGIALHTHKIAASFRGLAVTAGWQDLFTDEGVNPAESGWESLEARGDWHLKGQQLWHTGSGDQNQAVEGASHEQGAVIAKGPLFESYEFVVNARLDSVADASGCYGFYPALAATERGPLITVERDDDGWSLIAQTRSARRAFSLPGDFDPRVYQQFRFSKEHSRLAIRWEAHVLCEIEIQGGPSRVGLFARGAAVAFDMVRVTAIIGKM